MSAMKELALALAEDFEAAPNRPRIVNPCEVCGSVLLCAAVPVDADVLWVCEPCHGAAVRIGEAIQPPVARFTIKEPASVNN